MYLKIHILYADFVPSYLSYFKRFSLLICYKDCIKINVSLFLGLPNV
jgi:hypothetical protein